MFFPFLDYSSSKWIASLGQSSAASFIFSSSLLKLASYFTLTTSLSLKTSEQLSSQSPQPVQASSSIQTFVIAIS